MIVIPHLSFSPETRSYAIAGLYNIFLNDAEFKLSDYISLLPAKSEIESLYLHKLKLYGLRNPDSYIVGHAKDDRYFGTGRPLETPEDGLASLTVVHQSICIYYALPYRMGPILGFGIGRGSAYDQFRPATPGYNYEHNHPIYKTITTPFTIPFGNLDLNEDFKSFYIKYANSCGNKENYQWMLAANKFTDGITGYSIYDIVLNLAITLEAVATRDDKEIGYQSRQFMALLVGKTLEERQRIIEDIKKFYSLRSNMVHGRKINFSEEDAQRIRKVAGYLAKALILTCRRNIKEVHNEIENIGLMGNLYT